MERALHIGADVRRLSIRRSQLIASYDDHRADAQASCDELGVVVLDHNPRLSISTAVLQHLALNGTAVIVCDPQHLPTAVLAPFSGHTLSGSLTRAQVAMSRPRQKRAWQQLVTAKILAQASNLPANSPAQQRLENESARVRSGDPDNREAVAAKIYWNALNIRRRPRTSVDINPALDYGYAVTRAVLIRAIAGAGLRPELGVHHSSTSNPYCLADDLIEPLRPLLDRHILKSDLGLSGELTPTHKRLILTFTATPFTDGPTLMHTCQHYVHGFRRYVLGESDHIPVPQPSIND